MFFIKVENGTTVNHPVALENLRMIYSNFDVNNPPDGYLPFNKATVPGTTDPFTRHDVSYVVSDDSVSEVYISRTLTEEEKEIFLQQMEEGKPYPSWSLNRNTCIFEPPVSMPVDDKKYSWDEDTLTWIEIEL